MLRSLSKVASTAGAAATAAVVSVSSAAAHAEFPMKKFREDAQSRLSKPSPGPNYIEDEYDFCHEDFYSAFMGGVPSQEEVEEATRDLQATFIQNGECTDYLSLRDQKQKSCNETPVPDSDVESSSSKELLHDDQELLLPSAPNAEQASTSTSTSFQPGTSSEGPRSSSSGEGNPQAMSVRGTNSVVAHCVDLLQRDPDIQAAVVSLAKDPAIWDAFVKNEKVQELLRSKSVKLPLAEGSFKEKTKSIIKDSRGRENPFVVALLCVKNLVFEVMDTLVDLVGNVFGFLDQKVFGGKDSDPLDKPLKACMVLTILVLALVVLKRV